MIPFYPCFPGALFTFYHGVDIEGRPYICHCHMDFIFLDQSGSFFHIFRCNGRKRCQMPACVTTQCSQCGGILITCHICPRNPAGISIFIDPGIYIYIDAPYFSGSTFRCLCRSQRDNTRLRTTQRRSHIFPYQFYQI